MMDRKFYSGSSLDQALMKASRDLGISKEDLQYRQIEKKHGFLKMRRSVVIEVDPGAGAPVSNPVSSAAPSPESGPAAIAAPSQASSAPGVLEQPRHIEPEPRAAQPRRSPRGEVAGAPAKVDLATGPRPPAERFPRAEGAVADAIRESLDMLLELAGVEMESSVLMGNERYEIDLRGPDQELLLRDSGRPLLSIQHLLVRLVRGRTGEAVYCRVDCDQFHEIREERLRDLAQRVASEVASQGRSRLLESMAPDERRIVHLTLASDPSVDTESQGSGYFKRVKIFPS